MQSQNVQPQGVFSPIGLGRKRILRVTSGDTWTFSTRLFHPESDRIPATPENTLVEIALADTQFDKPLWSGGWHSGITPDPSVCGLVHIQVPNNLTKNLRRGSYVFSVRVSDLLKTCFKTELEGSFLVEYRPTSEQHSIPYKDKTAEVSQSVHTEIGTSNVER